MSVLLASLTASQGTLVKALFVVAATAIAAALLAYALRGLKLSVSPSRHAVFAVMLPVIALALVYALTANGPAVRQFLATAAVSFGNLTPMISPAQYATAPNPWPAPPADTPQRRTIAKIACDLLLQEKRVTISQMDTCIAQGTADPASAFTYITGDTLGAAWDDLSESEKQFAVDRANATPALMHNSSRARNPSEFPSRNFVIKRRSDPTLQRNCFSDRTSICRTGVLAKLLAAACRVAHARRRILSGRQSWRAL